MFFNIQPSESGFFYSKFLPVIVGAFIFVACNSSNDYDLIDSLSDNAQIFTVELFHATTNSSLTVNNLNGGALYAVSKDESGKQVLIKDSIHFKTNEQGIKVITETGSYILSDTVSIVGNNESEHFGFFSFTADKKPEIVLRGSVEIITDGVGIHLTISSYEHDLIASMLEHTIDKNDPEPYKEAMAVVYRTNLFAYVTENSFIPVRESKRSGIQFASNMPDYSHYKIIHQTNDYVTLFRNKPVTIFTTEMCGGMTATPDMIWQDLPPSPQYQVVVCQNCLSNGSYQWSNSVSTELISEALFGYRGPIDIWISKYYENGRPQHISAQSGHQTATFTIEEFREHLSKLTNHKNIILSDWFEIEPDKDTPDSDHGPFRILNITNLTADDQIQFIGWGKGHGAGICRTAARELADEGKNFFELIKVFYPRLGTGIIQRDE